jgi:hypothetical protein
LARTLPHAHSAVIEGAGHLAPLEAPARFRELLVWFSPDRGPADESQAGRDGLYDARAPRGHDDAGGVPRSGTWASHARETRHHGTTGRGSASAPRYHRCSFTLERISPWMQVT